MENNEDIKIAKRIIEFYKNIDVMYGCKEPCIEIKAIENLLSRLKTAEKEIEFMADFINMYTLSGEENQYCHKVINCQVVGGSKTCIECIKEWARKKVENES